MMSDLIIYQSINWNNVNGDDCLNYDHHKDNHHGNLDDVVGSGQLLILLDMLLLMMNIIWKNINKGLHEKNISKIGKLLENKWSNNKF